MVKPSAVRPDHEGEPELPERAQQCDALRINTSCNRADISKPPPPACASGARRTGAGRGQTGRSPGWGEATKESSSALVLEGRLRAQLAVWPRYVALRIRGDGTRYSVSRQSETLLFTAGGNSVIQTSDTSVVTEIHGRAFLDAEVARFFGFVPGLFGGLDYLSVDSSSDGVVSAVTPVFGAGVRQVSF